MQESIYKSCETCEIRKLAEYDNVPLIKYCLRVNCGQIANAKIKYLEEHKADACCLAEPCKKEDWNYSNCINCVFFKRDFWIETGFEEEKKWYHPWNKNKSKRIKCIDETREERQKRYANMIKILEASLGQLELELMNDAFQFYGNYLKEDEKRMSYLEELEDVKEFAKALHEANYDYVLPEFNLLKD